jgi:hypothetical protein
MTIESYYGTKLIKTSFIPTLLTDKEVTDRIIALQENYPNNFVFIRIIGSNVPTILYTYDSKIEKLIKNVAKPNRLARLYGNSLNK